MNGYVGPDIAGRFLPRFEADMIESLQHFISFLHRHEFSTGAFDAESWISSAPLADAIAGEGVTAVVITSSTNHRHMALCAAAHACSARFPPPQRRVRQRSSPHLALGKSHVANQGLKVQAVDIARNAGAIR